MTARGLFAAALVVGIATAAAAHADEVPTRIFHVGIVAGTPRTSPERVAFEDRLRWLGYVEGRNLAIDFVHYDDLDRLAAAVGELAQRRVDVRRCSAWGCDPAAWLSRTNYSGRRWTVRCQFCGRQAFDFSSFVRQRAPYRSCPTLLASAVWPERRSPC